MLAQHRVQSSAPGKGETLFCFVFKCVLEELVALGRSSKRGKKSLQVHIVEDFVYSSERLGFRCLQGREDLAECGAEWMRKVWREKSDWSQNPVKRWFPLSRI